MKMTHYLSTALLALGLLSGVSTVHAKPQIIEDLERLLPHNQIKKHIERKKDKGRRYYNDDHRPHPDTKHHYHYHGKHDRYKKHKKYKKYHRHDHYYHDRHYRGDRYYNGWNRHDRYHYHKHGRHDRRYYHDHRRQVYKRKPHSERYYYYN